jgi:serine phosphatase RsbU (regulator of sigma subunit)
MTKNKLSNFKFSDYGEFISLINKLINSENIKKKLEIINLLFEKACMPSKIVFTIEILKNVKENIKKLSFIKLNYSGLKFFIENNLDLFISKINNSGSESVTNFDFKNPDDKDIYKAVIIKLQSNTKEILYISVFNFDIYNDFKIIEGFYYEVYKLIEKNNLINELSSELEEQYDEFNSLFEQLHWFYGIAETIKSVHNIELLSKEIIETVKMFYFDSLWLVIYLMDNDYLLLLSNDKFPFDIRKKISVSEDGILNYICSKGLSLINSDSDYAKVNFNFINDRDKEPIIKKLNLIAFPMGSNEENSTGVMLFARKNKFTENDRNLLLKMGEYAGRTIEINRLYIQQREKDKLENDLALANDIQQRLLPKKYPDLNNFDVYGLNIPAKSIGGDYFDVFKINPEDPASKIVILVGDVAGKGISAALIMAMTRSFLRAAVSTCSSPVEVLKRINRQILEDTQTNIYVTMFFSIFNPETKELKYCKAGHNPPLLYHIKENKFEKLSTSGLFLGMFEEGNFEEKSIFLSDNDKLVLYTDGVTESMNENKEEFKLERFLECIRDTAEFDSVSTVKKIYSSVQKFVGNAPVHDDFTLLIVNFADNSKRSYAISFKEKNYYLYLDRILKNIEYMGVSRDISYSIKLCLDELIINFFKYSINSEEGWLFINYKKENNKIIFNVFDKNSKFNYRDYFSQIKGKDIFDHEHKGLMIVQCLMDELIFNDNGNNISLVKFLN